MTSMPLGLAPETPKAVWLGVAGLVLSAGLMIAMGFHKPVREPSRYRRR